VSQLQDQRPAPTGEISRLVDHFFRHEAGKLVSVLAGIFGIDCLHLAEDVAAEHPVGNQPRTHALVALMLLNGARLPTRVDSEGSLLRLKEQDRSRWNKAMIGRGMLHLSQSAAGEELTAYHLQAGIAACHCAATDYESTDWSQILSLYDRLVELDDSPIVALNRAVAVAQIHGPRAGIDAVQAIQNSGQLNAYYLLYAVLGEFEAQLRNFPGAAKHLRKALRLTEVKSEQSLLSKRLRDCEWCC
jgi:predicted RNA polymerase sigma factor